MLRASTGKARTGGKDINAPVLPSGPIADRQWAALAIRRRREMAECVIGVYLTAIFLFMDYLRLFE